jgi:predicted secreted protein
MADHQLDESGGEVAVRPGDRILITVTENASTGFVWSPTSIPTGVDLVESRTELGDDVAPGQAGRKVFVFEVISPASADELRLELQRGWEPEPIASVTVRVSPAGDGVYQR